MFYPIYILYVMWRKLLDENMCRQRQV
jgi:hypothetical protein